MNLITKIREINGDIYLLRIIKNPRPKQRVKLLILN